MAGTNTYQVVYLQTPQIGPGVRFRYMNNMQGFTGAITGVTYEQASGVFTVNTISGLVYQGVLQGAQPMQQHYFPQPGARKKERLTAIILAIVVGGFGIHRMYLDQYKLGVLYLLFCWTGIPAIVALVEGIMMAFQTDEEFDRLHNS